MNPLGSRSRVEELARLLDGAVAGPGSLTAGHAAVATRLRALAPTLDTRATPRADFRTALRQRLVAVATVQMAAAADAPYAAPLPRATAVDAAVSWVQTRTGQRRIGVTAGAMAGVIALTGVGVAASQSLPGQPFYAVKRVGENVQLQLASGDTAKGTKHLEFAATRLREVTALAHGDGQLSLGAPGTPVASGMAFGGTLSSKITDTLEDFDSETKSGQSLLESVYRKTGKPEPLRILKSFSVQQKVTLTALLPTLPASVQDSAEASLALVTEVGTDASQLLALGTCGGECYPGNAGPALSGEPTPTPGPSVSPDADNGVPPCDCASEPTPTPQPTPAPAPTSSEPAPSPAPTPTSSPTPAPTSSPGPLPTAPAPLPTILPTGLPTPLPTILPTLLPTAPAPLPVALPVNP